MCGSQVVSEEIVCRRVVRQFTFTEHIYRKGTVLARHAHVRATLTIVLAGQYTENFLGKSELCKPGTVRLLPAGKQHENSFDADSRYLAVELDPRSFPWMLQNGVLYAQSGQIQSPLAEHLGHRLYSEFRAFDDLSPLVIEGILSELLAAAERQRRAAKRQPDWLKDVYQFLQDRFADDLSLAEIAASAGVHPVYLCRGFKKRQGVTVGAYIRQLRIQRACELLHNSQMPLAEIALQCGFADQSHFSAVFKRSTGTTPSAFRTA